MNARKILFSFLFFLIAYVNAFAQFAPPSGYGKQENRLAPIYFFRPPVVQDTSMFLVTGANVDSLGAIVTLASDSVTYRWNGAKWEPVSTGSAVNSVNGYTGDVVLTKGDVGLGNVDNTSDLAKPVSAATQTALNLKANSAITLTAGTGLTGGGNLTANRSFAVNFGTAAGTVAQGNDSRINNGQTAFGWGNHASAGYLTTTTGDARYPQLSGSYANPSWLSSLAWSKITGAPTFWQSSNHPAGTTGSITYTGAEVPASFSFNSAGHYTANVKRTLTAADVSAPLTFSLGTADFNVAYTGTGAATQSNIGIVSGVLNGPAGGIAGAVITTKYDANYGFQIGNTNSVAGELYFRGRNAGVFGTWRKLWHDGNFNPADYAPVSGSGNYVQNAPVVAQPGSSFWLSGLGRTQSSFQVWKEGSNSYSQSLHLSNTGSTRGVNFQLNADANPGLSTWVHDGTAWAKRFEIFSNGTAQFYSHLFISHPTATLRVAGSVGIGTLSSPVSKLEVNGTITAPVLQSPSGSDLNLYTSAGQHLTLGAGGTADVIMDGDGRVSIGGTIPNSLRASLLEVQGNVWSTDAYLLGTSSIPKLELYLTGSDAGIRTMDNTAKMVFDVGTNGGINAMNILPSGDIGVGTAIASSTLHVAGSFATGLKSVTNSTITLDDRDHTVFLFHPSGTGASGTLNLPDPATCFGRELVLIERSGATWTLNETISRNNGASLTTVGGAGFKTLTIQSDGNSWWLLSTF